MSSSQGQVAIAQYVCYDRNITKRTILIVGCIAGPNCRTLSDDRAHSTFERGGIALRCSERLHTASLKAPTLPPSRGARARAREVAGNQRPWPADKVERWAIDRLIPYAKNARTHTDAQVAAIASSIKEWGWTTPALPASTSAIAGCLPSRP